MKTIKRNDTGVAVEDVQRRLRVLGYELAVDGNFLSRTERAVENFREKEGLAAGSSVDAITWAALVDATFALGDRMLYLRMPHFHGCDVRDLQEVLNALGFICGEPDSIFGGHTEHALRDFQASSGLIDDGVAGPSTYDAIERLRHAWEGKAAASEGLDEHMGFARAAEALESMEACFFGMDDMGREVARRMANLAQATTPQAQVTSADSLDVIPPSTMLLVGLGTTPAPHEPGVPTLAFSHGRAFVQRLRTAIEMSNEPPRRLYLQVPVDDTDPNVGFSDERWEQHLAIVLLDAFCTALS